MYWLNLGSRPAVLHVANCPNLTDLSVETKGWWYGPYVSRGAAIDVVLTEETTLWECTNCINTGRVTIEAGS